MSTPFITFSAVALMTSSTMSAQAAAAANYGSFTVGGSNSSYYAVQFTNNVTSYGSPNPVNTSDLVIYRSNVHENGSWYGTFNLVVSFHPTNWGNFNGQFEKLMYQTGGGSPYNDPVGDLTDGSTQSGGNDLIVWLKGGATYHWRNRETTAGWALANGNSAGGNITDSSGITRGPIAAQSSLITSAKNNFYTFAVGLATANSLLVGGSLHVPGGGDGTNPSLHFTSFAPSGFNPGGAIGLWLASNGLINANAGMSITGSVGIGTKTPGYALDVAGQIRSTLGFVYPDGSVQTTAFNATLCGGDYAESVTVKDDRATYEAGDVLVISDESGADVVKSTSPYSTAIAGIYSTKPGVIGRRQSGQRSALEIPMAMIGIVPTKVSSENGQIRRGDLLVSSSRPGYAMKGTDRSRMLGAVIGKAMESLDSEHGLIEVLVTLQ